MRPSAAKVAAMRHRYVIAAQTIESRGNLLRDAKVQARLHWSNATLCECLRYVRLARSAVIEVSHAR